MRVIRMGTKTGSPLVDFATYLNDSTTGFDYANQRWYSAGYGRFLTVDPYGGSAKISNPRTWNRYTYAGGDPIDAYDPSGLDQFSPTQFPCTVGAGEGTEVVNCELFAFRVDVFLPLDPGPLTVRQERDLIKQLRGEVKRHILSDCDALADYIDSVTNPLVGEKNDKVRFKEALAQLTPNQFPVPLVPFVNSNPGYVGLNPGGIPSGFQPQFQDQIPGADQAHHFAAFFQLGYSYGAGIAGQAAIWWEKMEGTAGNSGDIALGQTAATIGANVKSGVLPIDEVGQAIRDVLCK